MGSRVGQKSTADWLLVVTLAFVLTLIQPFPGRGQKGSYRTTVQAVDTLSLPDLPYGYEDLEPFLDSATLQVHHGGHHRAYTNKANAALEQWRAQSPDRDGLAHRSMVQILQHLDKVPGEWRTSIRNNGGGYLNHIFYWESMCHAPSQREPVGDLAEEIVSSFGSFEQFKREFSSAGAALFGSGYVWLCLNATGLLRIISTANQDCPLTSDLYPLLVLDVWEHAYYLKHQNRRGGYISDWWGVVCWDSITNIRQFWKDYLVARGNRDEL